MGPMTGVMAPMAAGLSDDDMQAVADYAVTLK
ncbi:c-type cytochrome [Thiomicrorhabdus sp.]